MKNDNRGLYDKFDVHKDGEPVDDCFVLRPGSDAAAVAALLAYKRSTTNEALADDLREWLRELGVAVDIDEDRPGEE